MIATWSRGGHEVKYEGVKLLGQPLGGLGGRRRLGGRGRGRRPIGELVRGMGRHGRTDRMTREPHTFSQTDGVGSGVAMGSGPHLGPGCTGTVWQSTTVVRSRGRRERDDLLGGRVSVAGSVKYARVQAVALIPVGFCIQRHAEDDFLDWYSPPRQAQGQIYSNIYPCCKLCSQHHNCPQCLSKVVHHGVVIPFPQISLLHKILGVQGLLPSKPNISAHTGQIYVLA
jgi:hypothetical protein